MRVLVPQDPEKLRWLAQQLAPAKGLQYITEVAPQKDQPLLRYLVSKSTLLRSLSSSFFRIPDSDPAASRGAFFQSVPHHKSNPTLWQCGLQQALFFQLRSRSPRHPADPQIKAARPIVARFETKAINLPRLSVCRPSPSPTFLLSPVSPRPPCSHHPHFASRTPDCRAHPFGIRATLLVSL
jgi:hypothetical protein